MTEKVETFETSCFQKELSRLEKDILQTAEWQYPSISLVVYDTALTGSKAVSLLEDRLIRRGQQVAHIAPNENDQNIVEDEIVRNRHWSDTVFFVMHLSFNSDEAIYKMISDRSDFVINNRLRVIYWVTEDDFTTYISQMPESWIFVQRFYSLVDTINWESIWSRIGTHTWSAREKQKIQLDVSANTSLSELLSLDIKNDFQGLLRRAKLLLSFARFYFYQQEYERALAFEKKALELAKHLDDDGLLAHASIVLLVLHTKLGRKYTSPLVQEKIFKNLERKSAQWVLLGSFYASLRMLDEAVDAYRTAIDLDRYNPAAFQGLGETLFQQQKYDRALDAFQKALDIEQNYSLAWHGLGKVYRVLGNYAKALECYQSSVDINYQQPDLWLEISEISDEETESFAIQRATVLAPDQALVWNALGNNQYRLKNYNEAIRSYLQAINLQKDFGWAYVNMALIHTQAKQHGKAILLLKKGAKAFQNDVDKAHAYYRLGKAYQQLENYSASAQAYNQASLFLGNNHLLEHYLITPGPIKVDTRVPVDESAKRHKADFSPKAVRSMEPREKKSMAKVLPQTEKLSYQKTLKKTLETNQQARNISYWFELGSYYFRNRMYDVAEDAYRIAIELEPDNAWAYYNLGKAYSFVGLYGEAVPLYEKSIQLFTNKQDKAQTWNQLGNVYRRMNEHSLAVAAYERARILMPDKNPMLARARASLLSNCYAQ